MCNSVYALKPILCTKTCCSQICANNLHLNLSRTVKEASHINGHSNAFKAIMHFPASCSPYKNGFCTLLFETTFNIWHKLMNLSESSNKSGGHMAITLLRCFWESAGRRLPIPVGFSWEIFNSGAWWHNTLF